MTNEHPDPVTPISATSCPGCALNDPAHRADAALVLADAASACFADDNPYIRAAGTVANRLARALADPSDAHIIDTIGRAMTVAADTAPSNLERHCARP